MLLAHPHSPRFICRKLYRWYVNPNVTQAIEDNVIVPLAQFLASPANNWAIQPVVVKLLTSQVFFDAANIGAIVKSPVELAVGSMRFFNQSVPVLPTEYTAFKTYFDFLFYRMQDMQMPILDQSSVQGYEAYYQTGLFQNLDQYHHDWLSVQLYRCVRVSFPAGAARLPDGNRYAGLGYLLTT